MRRGNHRYVLKLNWKVVWKSAQTRYYRKTQTRKSMLMWGPRVASCPFLLNCTYHCWTTFYIFIVELWVSNSSKLAEKHLDRTEDNCPDEYTAWCTNWSADPSVMGKPWDSLSNNHRAVLTLHISYIPVGFHYTRSFLSFERKSYSWA